MVETRPAFHHVTGEPLPPCQSCGRIMRPCRTTIEEYPATVPRVNFKMCSTCGHQTDYLLKRQQKIEGNLTKDSAEGLEIQSHNSALEYWLQRRRMRLLEQTFSVLASNRSRNDKPTR
jgi:hypothetical protein